MIKKHKNNKQIYPLHILNRTLTSCEDTKMIILLEDTPFKERNPEKKFVGTRK